MTSDKWKMENRKYQIANIRYQIICDLLFVQAPKCLIIHQPPKQVIRSERLLNQDVTNCPRCERRTPAARGECIYCGEQLPFASIQAAPPQRNIDPTEHAFNTVLEPFPGRINEGIVTALAAALQIESGEAQSLINAGKPVPLARSQTRGEAEMITALVRTCGLRAVVIPDEDLKLDQELLRARRIALTDSGLHVFLSGAEMTLMKDDISLLVVGELRNVRVDYVEGISGRRSQSGSVIESAEFRSDETLLDVYATSFDKSFRIKSDAFDYSGMVSPLSFRSEMNFRAALTKLRSDLPKARVDNDFSKTRSLLGRAWPERSRNESRGIRRTGLAFRAVAQATVMSDNRDQFDRYSRLMFLTGDA